MYAAVAAMGAAAACAAGQPRFTLEQVMSAPFASELAAAPKGARLAWVLHAQGVRNIWAAEAPEFKARRVTAYAGEDGQELSELRWTPNGASIVYVRGAAAGREGNYPNPLSRPEGAEQALWIVAAAGGDPRRLDEGSSPDVSPKGDRVVYVKKGQIWSAWLAGDPKPVQCIKMRGDCGSLRWSPDGSKFAFVVARQDHSFIGVFDLAAGAVRYMDPSVDNDSDPVWSPDGARIAFRRTPNSRVLALFGPRRSAAPWSIRVAEASSGAGREIWRAEEGRGSVFRGIEGQNQLLWAAGDRIVFPWEGDGWTHLYSVPAAGGEAVLLTPGDFEVEWASLSPDARAVVFASNQGDLERRHLWRNSAVGGVPEQLTSGDGIEWSPVAMEGGAVAFLKSDERQPGRPFVLAEGKLKDVAPDSLPREFPADRLVAPQPVAFKAADGMEIPAQVFLPSDLKAGERRPAVVFFHGGSRRQMLAGWHYREYYHHTYAFNQYLASLGYVVLSVNYRSGIGYGMEFREALNYGATGASEFNDVIGAARYLQRRPDVDPKRIGLWGGSYGGYLTALGLARASDLFAAGVDLHGVHDWRTETTVFLPSDELEVQQAALRLALQSSPLADVKTWRSPVLLVHGDDDRNVAFSQTVRLVEALREQKVEFRELIFPDEIHEFLLHRHWVEAFRAAAEFFDRHLR
jgi:dipeptidyl aminopeptidase/acylaminoacyl peptidase